MAQKNDGPQPVAELSYEEAREELVSTVRQLEQGGLSLDDSLALWERGEELGQRCEELLPVRTNALRMRWLHVRQAMTMMTRRAALIRVLVRN